MCIGVASAIAQVDCEQNEGGMNRLGPAERKRGGSAKQDKYSSWEMSEEWFRCLGVALNSVPDLLEMLADGDPDHRSAVAASEHAASHGRTFGLQSSMVGLGKKRALNCSCL